MRLLLVNPNMTQAMTDTMADIAREVAGANAEVVALTAPRGFPYVASHAEAQIAGAIVLEMIADHANDVDAAIIAAFGDPGLAGARELFDFPIVGMAEAAIMSAAMLGERFSIVTFSPFMKRWYAKSVVDAGLTARFTGVRTPTDAPDDVADIADRAAGQLVDLAKRAVVEDGAEVIILGGAPLAGLAPRISDRVPALVIDPISAAVAQAIALVGLTSNANYRARAVKPEAKASSGLSTRIADIIARGGTA
jgi:allantoin racemase